MSETIHALAKGSDAVEEYYSFLRSPVRERRYMKQIEGTVVLLGDSIFDNAHYVKPGQSVSDHLTRLQIEHKLLAVDGSVTVQVLDQLKNVPKNATDLFVSSGGNDALIAKGQLFPQSGISPRNALELLTNFQIAFRKDYSKLLNPLHTLKLPVTVCTIYDCIPALEAIHKTALSVFNDIIVLEATKRKFSIIDLRLLCDEASDYSNISPIEPSEEGGLKIAKAIAMKVGAGRRLANHALST